MEDRGKPEASPSKEFIEARGTVEELLPAAMFRIRLENGHYLYAPPTYNPCEATALIIDCHGALESAEVQAGM